MIICTCQCLMNNKTSHSCNLCVKENDPDVFRLRNSNLGTKNQCNHRLIYKIHTEIRVKILKKRHEQTLEDFANLWPNPWPNQHSFCPTMGLQFCIIIFYLCFIALLHILWEPSTIHYVAKISRRHVCLSYNSCFFGDINILLGFRDSVRADILSPHQYVLVKLEC